MVPEFSEFNLHFNVYNFSVILGSLVMGKFPLDAFFENEVGGSKKVTSLDHPRKTVDHNFNGGSNILY